MAKNNDLEIVRALLVQELAMRTEEGWIITSQTSTSAQLKKPRNRVGGFICLVILSLLVGLVIRDYFYIVAFVGLVITGIIMMLWKDELIFVDGYALMTADFQESENQHKESPQF